MNGDSALKVSGAVLSREQILGLIKRVEHPLVSEWQDLAEQVQPNGFDMTLRSLNGFSGAGSIGLTSTDRILPDLEPIAFDADGWVTLQPGCYQIVYNEVVDIPTDLMALGRPRSSLGRSGVTIHTAVWDAGYNGRSTSLLSVLNPAGFRIQQNARIMQLVFMTMAKAPSPGYAGAYQGENIETGSTDR